jgi:hypothetical protein
MEVEYTQELIPELKRVINEFTIYKHRKEIRPVIVDGEGNRISHEEWFVFGYKPKSMTRYEFQLYEEWREDVDSLFEFEVTP